MRRSPIVLAGAMSLVLFTCTSCSVEQLDADGNGWITESELLSAAFSSLCDGQQEPADEPPTDEPPTDEPSADEPPADEPPTDETPGDGTIP